MDLLAEYCALIRVSRGAIDMPTDRIVVSAARMLGVPAERLRLFEPPAFDWAKKQSRTAAPVAQPISFLSARGARVAPQVPDVKTGSIAEASIRSMSGPDVLRIAAAIGFDPNQAAPNRGVLTMRAKNAIYHFLRKGGTLPDC